MKNEAQTVSRELKELQRYSKHIEIRFKEIQDAEENANMKVINLLDEV